MVADQQISTMVGAPVMQEPLLTPPNKDDSAKFISWWTERINSAKSAHEEAFKRMIEDCEIVSGKKIWEDQREKETRYTVNLAQSEIAAATASLYARNPTFVAKRRPRMDFAIWDESPESAQNALLSMQQAMENGGMADPAAAALLMDIKQGLDYRQRVDRISKTLEVVFKQQLLQQRPDFKREMKQLIRRIETTGVGFLKLDYQRKTDVRPEASAQITDVAARLAHIETLMNSLEEGDKADKEKQAEELRIALKTLQDSNAVVSQEGLIFQFPRSTALIIDPACSQLRGFVGARFIVEEYQLTADNIYKIYKKRPTDAAKSYMKSASAGADAWRPTMRKDNSKRTYDDTYCVWEVYHAESHSTFTICEGMDEYLVEPREPKIILERFYPYYSLSFNDVEDDSTLYPPSTVRNMLHPQREYVRAREALRQHRIASKPHYVTSDGVMPKDDMDNMSAAPAHAVISLQGLQPGQKPEDLFAQVKKHAIDPNVYETSSVFEDIQRAVRRSDARFGATSRATATADTIAEDARQGEDKSKADDIDDFLSEVARDAGTVLLMNMTAETVRKIAGPGASWPETDIADLLEDLMLEVTAGSSGRPNKALEAANLQRLFPILVQIPGIKPDFLARHMIKALDTNIDITEAYLEGLPSIMQINQMAQTATGNPETDPTAQGYQGNDRNARTPDAGNQMQVSSGLNDIPETATENSILM